MRIVFMGTPEFACPSLSAVSKSHDVVRVVTRPDAVRGRGKRLEPSPVKALAGELGLVVTEASRMTPEVMDELRAAKADLCVVAAYGCILPDELLEMFPLGCVNVHASLLPRWRGAAPIQRAVLEGDELAGASIMRVVHELDAGAYCAQVSTAVAGKTSSELLDELGHLGAEALVEAIGRITDGTAVWTEQDESLVTYAHKIEKAEMRLDPADGALANVRRVLASTDAAPARCEVAGKGVRLMRARTCDDALAAGEVLVSHGRVALGCADGALEVLVVKPDGKREMQASAWAAGLRADHLAWGRI
ncbi:methionyl-tRNA formyltransferase [uncultured Parolsenella sp.]|uniref:methionyl-tRNA formyltransferase n=1 Tax=uncultured Parolsenella sp. TaxID=2083008 RepID=UPI0025917FFD|nr:methionyl-tRNA formyltransferase [uncultured Parolsenella sp.]